MSQTSSERLQAYLAQLPPQAQALLMREFERALKRGDDATVAGFVLGELRKVVRRPSADDSPRFDEPQRLLFAPLEPFLTDASDSFGPGQIRRNSLHQIWNWLARDAVPDAAAAYVATAANGSDPDLATRSFRRLVSDVIDAATADPDQKRAMAGIGSASVVDDVPRVGLVLKTSEAIDKLVGKLPDRIRVFGTGQVASVGAALAVPDLQVPAFIPFALRLVMQRLPAPWQIIRLGIDAVQSDDAGRVAAHPYGVAVAMAIHDLSNVATMLREDIKRGRFATACDHVKVVHDGVRGLRSELDIRHDSAWGRQLAMLRADISNALKTEIANIPGRVRRLLRQRTDKDVAVGTRLDQTEIDETAALIDFVTVCRSFASELAINEVTLKTYSELQTYLDQSTEILIESLRQCEPRVRDLRLQQAESAIRFGGLIFGDEYAVLKSRAVAHALADERKPARVG